MKPPLSFWMGACLAVAVVYSLWAPGLGPDAASQLPFWRYLILRWFHPLVWIILSISFAVRAGATPESRQYANLIAVIAFALYLTYFLCFYSYRNSPLT